MFFSDFLEINNFAKRLSFDCFFGKKQNKNQQSSNYIDSNFVPFEKFCV